VEGESQKQPIMDFQSVKHNSRLSSQGGVELSIGGGSIMGGEMVGMQSNGGTNMLNF
jgi:hypothetical protein